MKLPGWPPRDWRKLLAMFLLSGGGMAITIIIWRLIGLIALRSILDPWPLAYSLYGSQALVALVLISLGWVLGKSTISGTLPGGASFSAGGGDDAGDGAQIVADAAQTSADEVKEAVK